MHLSGFASGKCWRIGCLDCADEQANESPVPLNDAVKSIYLSNSWFNYKICDHVISNTEQSYFLISRLFSHRPKMTENVSKEY